jgi:hypothetical protein
MSPLKVLCLVLGAMALAGYSPAFDPKTEGQKLLARDAEWSALASAGTDVERTVSYWSE